MALHDVEILLRTKLDTSTADPSYHTLIVDPNTAVIAVGTAGDGAWSLVVDPVDGDALPAVEFVRDGGESASAIATAWAAAINAAAMSGPYSTYLSGAYASGSTVYVAARRTAPRFGYSLSSPGSTATITPSDSRWPIAQYVPISWLPGRKTTKVYVRVIPLGSSGQEIAVDTDASFSMRPLDGIELQSGSIVSTHGDEVTGVRLGASRPLEYNGGLLGIQLSAVTNPPTGLAALAVYVRPSDG